MRLHPRQHDQYALVCREEVVAQNEDHGFGCLLRRVLIPMAMERVRAVPECVQLRVVQAGEVISIKCAPNC